MSVLRKRIRPPGSGLTSSASRDHTSPSSSTSSLDGGREQVRVEARAEHRRVAQDRPVRRREPVDLAGDQRLDRVGQRVDRSRSRARPRAARRGTARCRPSGGRSPRRRAVAAGRPPSRSSTISAIRGTRQRQQAERQAPQARRRRRPAVARARVGDEEHLPQARAGAREAQQQVGARLVHEVDVLDDEHGRRARERRDEEAHRHVGEPLAQEALVEAARLRRGRQVEPEQDAEQRDPRHEASDRRARRPRGGGARPRRSRPPASSPSTGAHRCAQREVRRRRLVLLAPRVEHARSRGERSISSSTSRDLPIPASPAISMIQPLPAADVVDHAEQRVELGVPPDERRPPLGGRPSSPMTGPTIDARTGSALPFACERLDRRRLEGRARAVRARSRSRGSGRRSALLITRAAVLIASPKTR